MNYYYDIILNWSDNKAYSFYEWNDNDGLELVKKMPILKVKHKILEDIIANRIKIDEDTLLLIKDKTILNNKDLKIEYACLFTDGKNVIAKEFNNKGEEEWESNLLIEDELNVLEINYSLKDYNLNYEIKEVKDIKKEVRQVEEAKNLIRIEISNLYKDQNKEKLKYLYYEYKKEAINDINIIYRNIIEDLNKKINDDILKLYYIIKLSYHKV